MKFNPPLPKKNIKLVRKHNKEKSKVRETDPILSKSKIFKIGKKDINSFNRVRESGANKKILKLNSNNESYNEYQKDGSVPTNLSPINKLLYGDIGTKYRENYLYNMPILSNNFSSNLVLEGSSSNKWKLLNKGYIFYRDNNYSNNDFLHNKINQKNRRSGHSKEQILKDRLLNFSTENGAAAGHEFFYDQKIEDNINIDVHSFIDRHMKERRNFKDSYIYEETHSKDSIKPTRVSDNSRRSKLINSTDEGYTKPVNTFISVNGSKYEASSKSDSPVKEQKAIINTLKLTKTRSSEINNAKSYRAARLNRENPYKMSFNLNRNNL